MIRPARIALCTVVAASFAGLAGCDTGPKAEKRVITKSGGDRSDGPPDIVGNYRGNLERARGAEATVQQGAEAARKAMEAQQGESGAAR